MHPVLLSIGPLKLATYGVLSAAGYALGISWLKSRREEMGLSEEGFWSLIYRLFAGALVGAKLAYAAAERDWSVLWSDPRYGFVFYGGLAGTILTGWLTCRRRGWSFAALSDYFAVALPLGHAVGRLGCLAAGCCYGRPTELPWGVALAGHPSRHPVQLYEAAADLALFLALSLFALPRVRDGRLPRGGVFALYLALYGAARFFLEALRADYRGFGWRGMSPSQTASLAALALAAALWARARAARA